MRWFFLVYILLFLSGCAATSGGHRQDPNSVKQHFSFDLPYMEDGEDWQIYGDAEDKHFSFIITDPYNYTLLSYTIDVTVFGAETYLCHKSSMATSVCNVMQQRTVLQELRAIAKQDIQFLQHEKKGKYITINGLQGMKKVKKSWDKGVLTFANEEYILYGFSKSGKPKRYKIEIGYYLSFPDGLWLYSKYNFRDLQMRTRKMINSFHATDAELELMER
jgi:hypothetical protein